MFRQGSGINEASTTTQLFQCASQSLEDSFLKSDAEIVSKLFQELLSAMRRLAVIPVATGVLRSDLILVQMRQLRDEPFRAFAARVRGKADTCAFTIDCTCGLKINYTDHMIRDTLLNRIADDEICREILGSADMLKRAVNEIVALVQWFPTFLMSWTLLRIFLKVVDPLNKKGNKIHSFLPKTR